MHELSIAVALVEQVEAVLQKEGARCATKVTVRLGALAGVDEEALRMAFEVAAQDGRCLGAVLEVERVPARARCRACGAETEPEFPFLECGQCRAPTVELTAGRELLLKSVEMDVPDAAPQPG